MGGMGRTAAVAVGLLIWLLAPHHAGPAAAPSPDSLTGQVTSKADGALEGVVVIAQREGSPILTSVTSDATGRFQFPRKRVGAGRHSLRVRAAGYVLPGSGEVHTEVAADASTSVSLTLEAASPEQLSRQLTNVDWITSMPGTSAQKDLLVRKVVNCGFCHTLDPITRSRYTSDQFLRVIQRMNTYAVDNSSACGTASQLTCSLNPPGRFQISSPPAPLDEVGYWGASARELADYLASINLNGGRTTWDYPLTAMPRPSGRTSDAVVTVFPVPRQPSVIHDLDIDAQGRVWYGDSGWGYLSMFDPKTGSFHEYPAPTRRGSRPGLARVVGVQDVQVDTAGNVWAVIGGAAMAYFDPKTERWHEFDMPTSAWAFLPPFYKGQTETVWTTGRIAGPEGPGPLQALRLNFRKGEVDRIFPIMVDASGRDLSGPREMGVYGLVEPQLPFCYQLDRDPSDNFVCADFHGSNVITVNAGTGATRAYPTPTPNAGPRRGHGDDQGRFWFAEFLADSVAVLDPARGGITEFPFSTKYMSAYAAAPAPDGDVWASSTGSDRVVRINPQTGEMLEYLMPVYYDARTVRVDRSAPTTTVWLPNKNLSQLIRIELREQ
ncbi:MAG: hydrolase [Acidimicrobiia bacterium]|nr:hydrolase [Acidimicrobiia bacterium]